MVNGIKMKAKLIRVLDQYHLYDGDKAIATTIVGNPMLLPNLSKENCDEIFGVVDVEEIADRHTFGQRNHEWKAYIAGFNKAMELYQPTEIEVEIIKECPQCQEWGYVSECRNDCNQKFLQPKLDSSGQLLLKKI
jgi:hypothetical protein